MDKRAEEEGEEERESALGADNAAAATVSPVNHNGDVIVGLEKIPRCSMQNLTVIMTRSVENAFYREGVHLNLTQEVEAFYMYRAPGKSMYFLLSRTPAGPGRTDKQEQEEISRNHVQTFFYLSV